MWDTWVIMQYCHFPPQIMFIQPEVLSIFAQTSMVCWCSQYFIHSPKIFKYPIWYRKLNAEYLMPSIQLVAKIFPQLLYTISTKIHYSNPCCRYRETLRIKIHHLRTQLQTKAIHAKPTLDFVLHYLFQNISFVYVSRLVTSCIDYLIIFWPFKRQLRASNGIEVCPHHVGRCLENNIHMYAKANSRDKVRTKLYILFLQCYRPLKGLIAN